MIEWQARGNPDFRSSGPPRIPDLVWRILNARGLHSEEVIDSFLSPALKNLSDPAIMDGMKTAVSRLMQAYSKKEKVCVYGDFDLDGTSGLALLLRGLEWLGYEHVRGYQPKRLTEGYGLHAHAIEEFSRQGVSLVVTVDVGITAHEAVERANELGVDVIITDHHLPQGELPSAVAILNPNKGTCQSGLGHLCGTGVAFYLILALRSSFRQMNWLKVDFDPKKLLDCFAIGTLTDLVPLVGENRILVRHGLIELARTERPGLQALLEELGLGGRALGSQEVAIRFAPKLNALSRMEMGILPLDLYLANSRKDANELVGKVMANNELRLRVQGEAYEEAVLQANDRNQQGYIWVWSDRFHQGVIGLIATKLAQTFQVPAFVGSVHTEKGTVTGSARSPFVGATSVLNALEFSASSLKKFGGHSPAAGFEVELNNVEGLDARLGEFFSLSKAEKTKMPSLAYDVVCDLDEINAMFMTWFAHLEPFGTGWEPVVVRIDNLEIVAVRQLRGGHYKIEVKDPKSSQRIDILWFSPPPQHAFFRPKDSTGRAVDILGEPQWNFFAGKKSIQLLVKDLKFAIQ